MAQSPRPHNDFVLEQSEVYSDGRVDWLQQLLTVAFCIVNSTADCVTGHFRGWKWYKDLFQVHSSRLCIQPQVVQLRWHDNRHPVMDCGQQLIRGGGDDRAGNDRVAVGLPAVPDAGKSER